MQNYALYYPTIEFQDFEWLWSAALLWDRIYRIIPKYYKIDEPENIRLLTETGEIGIPIYPDSYIKETAHDFLEKVESGEWSAAALEFEIPEAYARIHQDKVDVELRNMIIAKGRADAHDEWLHVPIEFESVYMTYLANQVAKRNNLQLVTDKTAAWTGATFFAYNGEIADFPNEDKTQQLATLVLRDFIPTNILDIRPESILKFREKYKAERQRFLYSIRDAAKDFSECEDDKVYHDRIKDIKKEMEDALSDYKNSMQALNVAAWTGIKSISFPVVTKVASAISGTELDTSTLTVISSLGIGIGLVSGLKDWKEKRRKLEKSSDFSYLMHLERNWKGSALYNNDYNYFLCREMEEFIND
jgi:hypothetical protein